MTDLNNETYDNPRRRIGAALFCIFCIGIALFAHFIEGRTNFALIIGVLAVVGTFYYAAKIHGPSGWMFTNDNQSPLDDDLLTSHAYSHLSCNIHHEPDRVRDD